MEATRKIYQSLPTVLKMPRLLQRRVVEVILLPLDTVAASRRQPVCEESPFERFAGAWAGEPLTRDDQGTFQVSEETT